MEAAKWSLEECHRINKEVKDQTPQLIDGKINIPFWGSCGTQPSLSWVRTAAQAAMALKLHGILETTGMQSASARLQHASLPKFDHPSSGNAVWGDEGEDAEANTTEDDEECEITRANSFEHGVVSVQSELGAEIRYCSGDDGYDLLPLPVPAPERRILSAGATRSAPSSQYQGDASSVSTGAGGSIDSREARFHYGASSLRSKFLFDEDDDGRSAFLGDISVDEHIDKLREVIGSVDNTLSRCLASSGGIGRARRKRNALHLEIVQGFDSWKGLRGRFIGQRALLKGISGLEQSNEVYEESDLELIDGKKYVALLVKCISDSFDAYLLIKSLCSLPTDVSWQRGLASSAVSAAEHVRSAVRASKTAESAKAAASAAAFSAQSACESGSFPTIDEARAAQTRASIAQSHAFHAAVVEHEAKAVKRRATMALAHDVKGWNIHRKREVLKACIAHARSQHEATRRAVDAWSCLRDGFIGSTVIPSAQTRRVPSQAALQASGRNNRQNLWSSSDSARSSSLSSKPSNTDLQSSQPASGSSIDILSAENFSDLLGMDMSAPITSAADNADPNSFVDPFAPNDHIGVGEDSEQDEVTATIYQDLSSNGGDGKPIIVAVEHNILSNTPPTQAVSPLAVQMAQDDEGSQEKESDKYESMSEAFPFVAEPDLPLVTASPVDDATAAIVSADDLAATTTSSNNDNDDPAAAFTMDSSYLKKNSSSEAVERSEIMSASMQSLVDGLMTWGGQFDADDVLALPTGMAASIALEESEALGAENTFA